MNDCIRLAVKEDIPALCDIWQECFPDSREYIELFYRNNFDRINVLACIEGGKPVSAVHLIDASLINNNIAQPAKLIYATGTLPQYRKRGYTSALIKHAVAEAKESGYALFLKPSSPATAEFYKSFGFEEGAALNIISPEVSGGQKFSIYDLDADEYNAMREAAFSDISHIKWDMAHIDWCIKENEYFSGKTLGINYNGKDYFILAYPEDKALIINETDLSVEALGEIGGALCEIFGTEQIKAYMPAAPCEGNVSILLCNAKITNPYINLIMI